MNIDTDGSAKLSICLLLPPNYRPRMENPIIEMISRLSDFGHKITWILCSEDVKSPSRGFFNNIVIYTIPYIPPQTDFSLPYGFKMIPYEIRRLRFILKVIKDGDYNLVFVKEGMGVLDGLLAVYIRRKYKVPFAFYLASPLEMQWESHKIEHKNTKPFYYPIAKLNVLLKTRYMRKADLVLPITRWCGEALVKKGIRPSKIMPLPSTIDVNSFSSKSGDNIRQKYGLSDAKVVIYIGALAKVRNLSLLLEAFLIAKRKTKNIKLLMIGKGSDKENLEVLAEKLGIRSNITFTGWIPHQEVPESIAAADIGISPVPPLPFYEASSPIKMAEYMAAAKPVIANEEIFDQKEVLEQSGGGILVPFTVEAFAEAMVELLNNPEKAVEMGRRGREWVVENRSHEVLARQMERRLSELISTREEIRST
jgi:glycosyltransferase involved in cell wall biosynthesis